ncbi:MAG: hypothetical protein R3C14_22720 [Caldilineaceae bacterium]
MLNESISEQVYLEIEQRTGRSAWGPVRTLLQELPAPQRSALEDAILCYCREQTDMAVTVGFDMALDPRRYLFE